MAATPRCLQVLLAEQRLRNRAGNATLTEAEVADYAKAGFQSGVPISQFAEAAWKPGAETSLHERVESICHELVFVADATNTSRSHELRLVALPRVTARNVCVCSEPSFQW